MAIERDFSPLLEQGTTESQGKLRDRFRRDDSGPVAQPGVALVRLLASQGWVSDGYKPTAGERRHGPGIQWAKVDVRPHALDFSVEFADASGRLQLVAEIRCSVSVSNPSAVAEKGITSARDFIEPVLLRVVTAASSELEAPDAGTTDEVGKLASVRTHAEKEVNKAFLTTLGNFPSWLDVEVTSTKVVFGGNTKAYLSKLVAAHETGTIGVLEAGNRLDLQDLWRTRLGQHLSDPGMRLFEAAFADPTAANISAAVQQVDAQEYAAMMQGFELMKTLLNGNYVDKGDQMSEIINQMGSKLEQLYAPRIKSVALPAGSAPAVSSSDPETASDLPVVEQDGDRNWDEA